MEDPTVDFGKPLRNDFELHVVELIKEALQDGKMSEPRAQQIARMVLDALRPGHSVHEVYQCALELCSRVPELMSLIPSIVKDFKANNISISPQEEVKLSMHPLEDVISRGFGYKMYCVKCRAERFDLEAERIHLKNGGLAIKGKCPVCGTGMYRIGS